MGLPGPNLRAHKKVREVAMSFASEVYSELMRNNREYERWRALTPKMRPEESEIAWCRRAWPCFINEARATMAKMLTMPYPEELKDEITDALIKDNSLRAGKVRTRLIH